MSDVLISKGRGRDRDHALVVHMSKKGFIWLSMNHDRYQGTITVPNEVVEEYANRLRQDELVVEIV